MVCFFEELLHWLYNHENLCNLPVGWETWQITQLVKQTSMSSLRTAAAQAWYSPQEPLQPRPIPEAFLYACTKVGTAADVLVTTLELSVELFLHVRIGGQVVQEKAQGNTRLDGKEKTRYPVNTETQHQPVNQCRHDVFLLILMVNHSVENPIEYGTTDKTDLVLLQFDGIRQAQKQDSHKASYYNALEEHVPCVSVY